MGNSASNANNPNRGPALPPSSVSNRTTSASPGPGNPHRSMRSKKKSLELPDLANLTITQHAHAAARGRPAVPAKTASIPIPTQPQGPFNHYREAQAEPSPDPRTSRNLDSASDVYLAGQVIEPSTHQPFPPVSRAVHYHNASAGGAPRGRQQPMSNARHQAQVTRLQELYDRSHGPPAPPSSPATSADSSVRPGGGQRPGFVGETVRSSIPIALGKAAKLAEEAAASMASPMKEDLLADPVPVKIVWKGGGREVVLARAGDNEWKGRQPMERESPQSNTWTTTVSLRPGTHHIRFLIDGTWRVADDLPTAVDDQGSLANYVAVPLNYGFPPPAAPPAPAPTPTPPQQAQQAKKLVPGQSFWSADSSADGEGDAESTTDSASAARKASSSDSKHAHTPQSAAQAAAVAYTQARWTNVLPLELIEAAREEEAYLAASAGQYEAAGSGAGTNVQRVMGFVPAPNIPPAPGLPRHLDKLILNSKVGERVVALAGGSRDGRDGPRERERDGHGRDKELGGVGSGQGGSGRRERERRERERERGDRERGERDRERGTRRRPTVPPPPPPSEDGSGDQEAEVPMNPNVNNTPVLAPQHPPPTSTSLPEHSALAAMAASSQPLLPSAAIHSTPASTAISTSSSTNTSTPASTNTTPPATKESTPTPSASTSAGALTDSTGGTGSNATSTATSTATSGTTTAATSPQGSAPTTPTAPLSPGATHAALKTLPPGTPLPAGLPATAAYTPPLQQGHSQPTTPGPHPHPPPLERAGISGSRIITIDTANMPTLTDDGSVLPVPSHVVLHHLSTSAIRNGVLAVANTTRYRQKYLTTIYYKPT